MHKLRLRVTAAAAALCVTAAFSGVGPAAAATSSGLGTTKASTTILGLQLGNAGSLLNLRILGDDAQSNIDNAVSAPEAFSRLVPASLTSKVVPALDTLTAGLPTFESRTPGGKPSVSGSAVDLAKPAPAVAGVPLPVNILGGSVIPSSLTSALDDAGARSALDAALADLSLVSGLVSVKSVKNTLGTAAAPSVANGSRTVAVDAISVLKLADLLKGLGIDLADLPISVLSNLLSTLKVPVALPTGAPDLASAVATVQSAIGSVTQTVGASPGTVDQVVSTVAPVNDVVRGLPTQLPLNNNLLTTSSLLDDTVGSALATLQGTLKTLLGTALGALGNLSLLELDGAEVGVITKATDTLSGSSAVPTGRIGNLKVLGVGLPGVDLLAVADLVNSIAGTLTGALGAISPDLANLVHVGVLEKTSSVASDGGYNKALAGIDVLNVAITPPANLAALVSSLTGGTSSPLSILGGAGIASNDTGLPVLGSAMGALNGVLDLPAAVGALVQGATLKVGSIQSASQFAAAAAPAAPVTPANKELPRTGTDTRRLAAAAVVLAMFSVGIRRRMRRPTAG